MIKNIIKNEKSVKFEFSVKLSDIGNVPNTNLAVCQIFFNDFKEYVQREYNIENCNDGFFNQFKESILGEDKTIKKFAVIEKDKVFYEYRACFEIETPPAEEKLIPPTEIPPVETEPRAPQGKPHKKKKPRHRT